MPRKKRPLERDTGVVRDASLLVIASEDTHAVQQYFSRFRVRRVQFMVLPTEDGRSSPTDVVRRLDAFVRENPIEEGDQFWYCGDADHWIESDHIGNLVQVLRHCKNRDYGIAMSNPCFELWLLLHFVDRPASNEAPCKSIGVELSRVADGYSKRMGCGSILTTEMVHQAIRRAKNLDNSTALIPARPTTRVYRIIEELLKRQAIELH